MIATGLVFLLGALVAMLLALLFVPVLWRNAQRLARRDFAATMPATMSEIRAEVDRVRAEAAVSVRRHEMQTAKAREGLAVSKAEIGRLTGANARLTFGADQHVAEANSLRTQIVQLEQKLREQEDDRLRLAGENEELKELLAEVESEIRVMDERARSMPAAAAAPASGGADAAPLADQRDEPDAVRIAAATTALLALAREHRRARADAGPAAAADAVPGAPAVAEAHAPLVPDKPTGEGRVVDELRALAAAPRPTDPVALRRQNGQVRERIADVAARIIQLTIQKEGAESPTRKLLEAGQAAEAGRDTMAPDLAERVRRLSQGTTRNREAPLPPQPPEEAAPSTEAPADETAVQTAEPVSAPAPRAKRRRGASRSRPPSQR